ncbi:hypothetical protein ACFVIN_01475 [Streptomyces prasinus]|uniref:hypothetical protein n=1 Tax=Streptomyces prasinus TaxID=67345 RepID=UPI00364533F4
MTEQRTGWATRSPNMQITAFWGPKTEVRSSPPPISSLYIDPDGMAAGAHLSLLFASDVPLPEQAVIADRVLAGVQRWRDGIVEKSERARTAEDELAAARAEIARLKGEDTGDDTAEVSA